MTDIALHVDQTRSTGTLGASAAAAALGLDQYTPPILLWRKLRGLPVNDDKPAFVQEAAEWGQLIEPLLRGKYALERTAIVHVPESSLVLDGWLSCTPDGIVTPAPEPHLAGTYHGPSSYSIEHGGLLADDGTAAARARIAAITSGTAGMWQGKTCSMYKRDEWATGVPEAYEVQVRVEMAVCKLPWSDVTCLIGGQQRVTYRVERDLKIEHAIVTDLRAFWESVQSGVEPDVDGSSAWREYASSKMRPSSVAIVADDSIDALLANWSTARKNRKALEEIEEQHKTALLLKLSAAGATAIESARFGRLSAYKAGARTDWKGVAASLGCKVAPDAFKKPGTTWTIRAPGDED